MTNKNTVTTFVIEWKPTVKNYGTVQVRDANSPLSRIEYLSPEITVDSALHHIEFVRDEFLKDDWRIQSTQPVLVGGDFDDTHFVKYYIEKVAPKPKTAIKVSGDTKRTKIEVITD